MKLDIEELAALSPFELKDKLIQAAASRPDRAMLNAGRGNPNFLATVPRHAFFQFGLFAMGEAERSFAYMPEGVGGFPKREGIEARFEDFVKAHAGKPGVNFLRAAVSYVRDHLGLSAGDFIYEMCEAVLGCNYPVPDRMLRLSERIVGEYVRKEMIGSEPFAGDFDMYAVEGGTAAMTYLFNTLQKNRLLLPGDSIALGLPIFTPYIAIPQLTDYNLVEVGIESTAENGWQFSKKELDKLLDPKVKAFFLVNPSNPPSVRLSDENLRHIAAIVKKRPDLIILTDDVYGTFAEPFTSLFAVCPHNTILVYSFSKYFGATGWRLGVVAVHERNILDKSIAALPAAVKKELDKRYESISTEPRKLKFIDRLVADSRAVALNHTAGLSTPAQVQMVMFSLFALMDQADSYKKAMQRLVRRRKQALYREMGAAPKDTPLSVDYYHMLDVEEIARRMHGDEFADWFLKNLKPNQALFELAKESGVVLLPARGFGTTHPSFRISLANLTEVEYTRIGKAINLLGRRYLKAFREYTDGQGKGGSKTGGGTGTKAGGKTTTKGKK